MGTHLASGRQVVALPRHGTRLLDWNRLIGFVRANLLTFLLYRYRPKPSAIS
jgi:hypothetical protein